MSNVLNSIIANQPINPVKKQAKNTAYTFSSEGKITPMKDKGRLLPSKIFDSPIDIAKDFKGDLVSIGKAARGKANDHELGRINDFAMKLGGLGLAAYLCTKNPQKLSKAMEFVGVGTFFGAMALWPKLAIQAPLRARTGVDVHQKYIDSQGRKKMLHQDPQYDLTDLYSREDLDKMGKKLGVAENLPDRDRFIKQRAKETAIQANTLWMMTAGPATPLISALACNRLEQPVNTLIENSALVSSKAGLDRALNPKQSKNPVVQKIKDFASGLAQKAEDRAFERYLNSGKVTERGLAERIAGKAGSTTLNDTLTQHIKGWAKAPEFTLDKLKQTLAGQDDLISILDKLDDKAKKEITDLLKKGDMQQVAKRLNNKKFGKPEDLAKTLIALIPEGTKDAQTIKTALTGQVDDVVLAAIDKLDQFSIEDLASGSMDDVLDVIKTIKKEGLGSLTGVLEQASAKNKAGAVFSMTDDVIQKAKNLRTSVSGYATKQGKLNKFISARVGQKSNTHIANQWDRVWNTFIKALKLDGDELKLLANDGDLAKITDKIDDLVRDDARYDKVVTKLMKLIDTYETRTGVNTFGKEVSKASTSIADGARAAMKSTLGDDVAERLLGNITTEVAEHVADRSSGARSSFYRLIQTLDIFKKAQSGALREQIKKELIKNAPDLTEDALNKSADDLVAISKKIILAAGSTDYTEKLTTAGYKLTAAQYKSVMSALFDSELDTTITTSLNKSMGSERVSRLVGGLKAYQDEFMTKVVNWKNGMTPDLTQRIVGEATGGANAKERANLVASEITSAVKKAANNKYNSNKWLKIFGISFAALTAVTLIAGLFIGRKGETEKQVEAESKVNG